MPDLLEKLLETMETPGDNGCLQFKSLKNKGFSQTGDKETDFSNVRQWGDNATNTDTGIIEVNLINKYYFINKNLFKTKEFEQNNEDPLRLLLTNNQSQNLSAKRSEGEAKRNRVNEVTERYTENPSLCLHYPSNRCGARAATGDGRNLPLSPLSPPHRDYIDDEFDVMLRDIVARTTEVVLW